MARVSIDTALKRASTLEKNGRIADARALCDQILQARPQHGKAMKLARRLADARPATPQAYDVASLRAALAVGQTAFVIEETAHLLRAAPDRADLWSVYGCALLRQDLPDKAAAALMQAVSLAPEDVAAQVQLGQAFYAGDKLEAAEAAFHAARARAPRLGAAALGLALVHIRRGEAALAQEFADEALCHAPDESAAHNARGLVCQLQGQMDGARACFEKAVTLDPTEAEAWYNLARVRHWTAQDPRLAELEHLTQTASGADLGTLHFALGEAQEALGEVHAAFQSYHAANSLKKAAQGYDIATDHALFDQIRTLCQSLPDLPAEVVTPGGPVPIFILGMPRSGTTLVEQILSAHHDVTGAGELTTLAHLTRRLSDSAPDRRVEALMDLREEYLKTLRRLSGGAGFVTDKMPQNFRLIGVICAAFPEARIVHVTRTPGATCWSGFKQRFVTGGLGYCHDLRDLAAYFDLYTDLMITWHTRWPGRLRDLDYDALTASQEAQTRSLVKDLGLDWDPACLAPERNVRAVATASSRQVRRAVYGGSSQGWERFRPFLGGAFDDLRPWSAAKPRVTKQEGATL